MQQKAHADKAAPVWDAASFDPLPEDAIQLKETLQELLRPLGEREQEIISLRLQGHSTEEIGKQVGRSQYTVQAVLRRTKKRLQAMLDVDP